jgi:hypothetical protein
MQKNFYPRHLADIPSRFLPGGWRVRFSSSVAIAAADLTDPNMLIEIQGMAVIE